MAETTRTDWRRESLVEQLPEVRAVRSGESLLAYVNGPNGMIIEVTQSNAHAVEALFAYAFAGQHADLFPGFDPEETPRPTQSEILDSTGGPFGSINEAGI